MLHDEPAAGETSFLSRFPPEKIAAAVLVALLHLVLVWLLLQATVTQIAPPPLFRALPITIWLKTSPTPKPPEPKPKEKKKERGPAPVRRAIGPILPAPSGAPPESDYNGLRALGRYLNNCSAGNYEALSPKEWAHCLGNQWTGSVEAPLVLGPEPDSPWKLELEKRKAPPRKVEHECENSFNAHLGLPCYNYAN